MNYLVSHACRRAGKTSIDLHELLPYMQYTKADEQGIWCDNLDTLRYALNATGTQATVQDAKDGQPIGGSEFTVFGG